MTPAVAPHQQAETIRAQSLLDRWTEPAFGRSKYHEDALQVARDSLALAAVVASLTTANEELAREAATWKDGGLTGATTNATEFANLYVAAEAARVKAETAAVMLREQVEVEHRAVHEAEDALLAAEERCRELTAGLEDFAENGTRFDLNPTRMVRNSDDWFAADSYWLGRVADMDREVRERARRALVAAAGSTTAEPADDDPVCICPDSNTLVGTCAVHGAAFSFALAHRAAGSSAEPRENERGKCPYCERDVRLNGQRQLVEHAPVGRNGDTPCFGSGRWPTRAVSVVPEGDEQ